MIPQVLSQAENPGMSQTQTIRLKMDSKEHIKYPTMSQKFYIHEVGGFISILYETQRSEVTKSRF
jgi:hypothetical protein